MSKPRLYDFKFYTRPLVNLTKSNPLKDIFVSVETKAPGFTKHEPSDSLQCVSLDRLSIEGAHLRLDWNVISTLFNPMAGGEYVLGTAKLERVKSVVRDTLAVTEAEGVTWGRLLGMSAEQVHRVATAIRKTLQWKALYTPPAKRLEREKKAIASAAAKKAAETRQRIAQKREEKNRPKPIRVCHGWLCGDCGMITLERYRQKPNTCAGCGKDALESKHLVWKPVI